MPNDVGIVDFFRKILTLLRLCHWIDKLFLRFGMHSVLVLMASFETMYLGEKKVCVP